MSELFEALTARVRARPADPLITWYGPDGVRTELSAVTFATAVAKTAGALVAEWDVEPGAGVRLELPLHWQLPVWLAACDLAGLVVVFDDSPIDVVVTDSETATEVTAPTQHVITSTTTFGLPGPALPAPLLDHARDAMGQPDVYLAPPAEGAWRVAGQLWDVADIADRARALTAAPGGGPHERLLVTPHADGVRRALAVWPAPLVSGSSVVLCAAGDPDAIGAAEHAGVRIG